jgi:hypothetical protein
MVLRIVCELHRLALAVVQVLQEEVHEVLMALVVVDLVVCLLVIMRLAKVLLF